jgi:hypothetical protein
MHAELNAWTKMSAACSAAENAALYRDTAARRYRLAVRVTPAQSMGPPITA